jgi:uncharacterized membrane protein
VNFLLFLYHAILRPYKDKMMNFLSVMNELLVVVCSGLIVGFIDKNQDKKALDTLGWTFISIIAVVLAINWFLVVPAQIYGVVKKIVRRKFIIDNEN